MNDPVPPVLNPPPLPRRGARGWCVFLAVLLAPAVVMGLVARSSDAQGVVLFVGGSASALVWGIWLAQRIWAQQGWIARLIMAGVFIAVLFSVKAVLCLFCRT